MTGNLFDHADPSAASEWFTAHCDGGSRGNPGPSGFGAVIEDPHGRIVATPRVDFFGGTIQGALSPTLLNGDDGVSADQVGVDTNGHLGLPSRTGSADELAEVAASWFSWILATFSLRLE